MIDSYPYINRWHRLFRQLVSDSPVYHVILNGNKSISKAEEIRAAYHFSVGPTRSSNIFVPPSCNLISRRARFGHSLQITSRNSLSASSISSAARRDFRLGKMKISRRGFTSPHFHTERFSNEREKCGRKMNLTLIIDWHVHPN